ncbi:hypothetical protein ALC53_00416 [Atta colombica]|uniref:Uncharacterized protein n=1 Tax=Atta colombica TaxID=520822 RepID=A0A195BY61_9HYME|nr:hypothetical protein ALC53_00416 [Atta colombica]
MDLSVWSTRKPVGDSVFWNDTKHPERVFEDSARATPFRNSEQNHSMARTGNGESPWPKLQVVCSPSTLEYVTVVHKIVLIVVCFGLDVFL